MANKQPRECCKECGRSISRYARQINKQHIQSLWNVYRWCMENNRHEFSMNEIKHLLSQQGYTKFAYMIHGGGLVYRKEQAQYGINIERCGNFFANKMAIPTKVWKSPIVNVEPILDEYRTLHEIPDISEFLDDKGMYVVEYHPEPIHEI